MAEKTKEESLSDSLISTFTDLAAKLGFKEENNIFSEAVDPDLVGVKEAFTKQNPAEVARARKITRDELEAGERYQKQYDILLDKKGNRIKGQELYPVDHKKYKPWTEVRRAAMKLKEQE